MENVKETALELVKEKRKTAVVIGAVLVIVSAILGIAKISDTVVKKALD